MEKSLVRQVIDLISQRLTENTRNLLADCDSGLCEQPGTSQQTSSDRARRQFSGEKALRFDFDSDVLIAFATSTSEFRLQDVREEYKERQCKRKWIFIKKCWTETKYR